MDQLIEDLKRKTGVTGEVTLDSSYRAIDKQMRADATRASQRIAPILLKQKPATDAAARATSGPASEFTLYRDVDRRLAGLNSMVTAQLEQQLPASEQGQLADLDAVTLRPGNGGTAAYATRFEAYAQCMQMIAPSFGEGTSLFGHLAEAVGQQSGALTALRERVPRYDGSLRVEFGAGMRALLDAASAMGTDALFDAYRRELDKVFPDTLGFPLGSGPALSVESLRAINASLDKVRADIAATGIPADARRTLESRFTRISRIAAFASQLVGPDGNPAEVKLILLRDRDQGPVVEQALGARQGTRQPLSRVYPSMRIAARSFRVRGLTDNLELDKFSMAAPLPRFEFFTTPDPKAEAEASIVPSAEWGVLRLIQRGSVRRVEGKEWDAVVRLNDRGTELVLAVSVVFSQPIPALDHWPAVAP